MVSKLLKKCEHAVANNTVVTTVHIYIDISGRYGSRSDERKAAFIRASRLKN